MASHANHESDVKKHSRNDFNIAGSANYNRTVDNLVKSERLMEGVAIWTAYYRKFPHAFVKDYFGIELKDFQKVILYNMFQNAYSMFLASRGMSKTYLTAIFCVTKAILYPDSKIIVAAGVKSQAMKIVTEKIPELMNQSSNNNLKREILDIKTSMNTDDPNVTFRNGSWIKVVPSTPNARSARASVLILDEFRMIDFKIYKNVLRRFLAVDRQPKYLSKPEYAHLRERNQEIFLTSAWYKFHWAYDRYRVFLSAMKAEKPNYWMIALPYQFAIMSGLSNAGQIRDEMAEDDFDVVGWSMEMDVLFFGESEKAYYKLDKLNNSRKEESPWYSPEFAYLIDANSRLAIPKKKGNEIRLIGCDISLMDGDNNDASVYTIMSLVPNKSNNGYVRTVHYMEQVVGAHTKTQALRIREMFEYYNCDYIVLDCQAAGASIFDILADELIDPESKVVYEPFSCVNDPKMAERCTDKQAPKVIYSIKANESLNSDIAISMQDVLWRNKLRLLVDINDGEQILSTNIKDYYKLTPETKFDLLMPYRQATLLINEMINLEKIENEKGYIKLKERSGMRKDRYSSISYTNYIATELERKAFKREGKKKDWGSFTLW